jgi:homoserine O-acetyltransferase
LRFASGEELQPWHLVYECYGKLNANRDNAILIHHALSADCHVASHTQNSNPGWWEEMVGPNKAIDTNHFYVICINNLGSCFGSISPISINPHNQKSYRADFPALTFSDILHSQQLLLQELGIRKLYAVIGSSLGGMLSLQWAIDYPDSVARLICIAACHKAYAVNIANRTIQREIIQLDPEWQGGYYEKNPIRGLQIARKLGHYTYRHPSLLNKKFADNPQHIRRYLAYNAHKFAEQYDANCYLYMLDAMDNFDVSNKLATENTAFERIKCDSLIISVNSDILFTPDQQLEIYKKLAAANKNAKFITHYSEYGHDSFLVDTDEFGKYIRNFL